MEKFQNDIILEKALSYGRLVVNFIIHLILSLIVGPIIAVFLFASYTISYRLTPSAVTGIISQSTLVGYWFLLIIVLMFGLVWLGFINNRKNDFLPAQTCQRWYYEFWNTLYDNIQEGQNIPALPPEASKHYKVRTIAMDKDFPRVIALFIVMIMAPIMFFFIFFSPSLLAKVGVQDTGVLDVAKIAALSFWSFIFLLAFVLEFFFVRKTFFKPNLENYVWRQFWINLMIVTLMNDNLYSKIKGYKTSEIADLTKAFSDKYPGIYSQMTSVLSSQKNTLSVDQVEWLENMITYFEGTPTFLIPPSISLISKFYAYSLIIAGTFSSVLLGPATYILNEIMKFIL